MKSNRDKLIGTHTLAAAHGYGRYRRMCLVWPAVVLGTENGAEPNLDQIQSQQPERDMSDMVLLPFRTSGAPDLEETVQIDSALVIRIV